MTRLEISPTAEYRIDEADMLWREKRPAASSLFIDELDAALDFLTRPPRGGKAYPTPAHPNLRRRDGEHTGATPGRVVRGPGWRQPADVQSLDK